MEVAKRIVVNTAAQYTKSVINTAISLYTVRLVLRALGEDDYGIYSLIAGVIALLGFVTNAMVITTQRYLSYHYGRGDRLLVRKMFANSFFLHLAVGLALALLMLSLRDFFCYSYLNIVAERRAAASDVYLTIALMVFVTFITAPFKALFIARENIVFISVVEIVSGFLRLLIAISLSQVSSDQLVFYAVAMASVFLFELLVFSFRSCAKLPECSPRRFVSDIDKGCLRELTGFATWTTYGMGVIMARQQGLAILINKFFGTVLNASFGIATHIYAAVTFVHSSVMNAMNPQIMKAEGLGDRQRMLRLAAEESKIITVLMLLLTIPIIFEMEPILEAWLGEVPPMTVFFSQAVFIVSLLDMVTYGLHTACQAIGKIRTYTLLAYTPKLLILVVFWWQLRSGYSLYGVMYSYMAVELLVSVVRLIYLRQTVGLSIGDYVRDVVLPLVPLLLVLIVLSWSLCHFWHDEYRFLFSVPFCVCIGTLVAWHVSCTNAERQTLLRLMPWNKS